MDEISRRLKSMKVDDPHSGRSLTELLALGCGKKSLAILPQMFLERRMTKLIEPALMLTISSTTMWSFS